MTAWRWTIGLVLLGVIGLPLTVPLLDLARHPAAWRAWEDGGRLLQLASITILLVAGTLSLALPTGILGAVLLYRSDMPLRAPLRFLTIVTLFVPLPLFASAWQATLGEVQGWTAAAVWSPWARTLPAAIGIHAVAALPWVVWIVGFGLGWVERELEEDALLDAGPWRVLWRVTLPRCRAAIGAAALWVALQTSTEITVTDMMQVRTFAEEVYTQFVLPDVKPGLSNRDVLARSVAVSLPSALVSMGLVLVALLRWEQAVPALRERRALSVLVRLGRLRWLCLAAVLGIVAVSIAVPLASLIRKAGLEGSPPAWSSASLATMLGAVARENGRMLLDSVLVGLAAGLAAATLALLACWSSLESRGFRLALLLLTAAAWALPGPVVGVGLKESINASITVEEWLGVAGSGPLRVILYDGPSPVPAFAAALVRYFPYAVALLWPVVRLLPRDLIDAARVDGAGPFRQLFRVVVPLTRSAWARAVLAVAVLALGEVSAGKLVETPGGTTFALWVFTQMHYGVTQKLAALCIVLLAAVAVGGALVTTLAAPFSHDPTGERGS